jgi:hypothetical protein
MSVSLDGVLQTLDAMERYFRGGFGWGKYALHDPETGRKCLQGAVSSVRASDGKTSWVPHEAINAARHYIEWAVREHGGEDCFGIIESFNDDFARSYRDIAAVIARAKQLATMEHARQMPPPAPVVEILRPVPVPVPQFLPPPLVAQAFAADRAVPWEPPKVAAAKVEILPPAPAPQAPAPRPALTYQPEKPVEIVRAKNPALDAVNAWIGQHSGGESVEPAGLKIVNMADMERVAVKRR